MNIWFSLLITAALLAANAFFVASEFAVMSSRRSRVEPLLGEKRAASTLIYAMEHVTLMMATCQLGITLCSVALGAVSEPAIASVIEGPLVSLGVPSEWTHPIALVIALAIVVYLHVVLGEMVPKNLAITTPEKAALWLSPPLVLLSKIFMPIIYSLNWLANHMISWAGFEPKSEVASTFTADEVASIVEVSEAAGVLDVDTELISGALEFSEHTAGEVMVPMDDLLMLDQSTTVQGIDQAVSQSSFSRFPVQGADGGVVGYIHIKDVLDVPEGRRAEPIPGWKVRPLVRVWADDEVETALRTMQEGGSHIALVESSEGSLGVLFLEDILEELVGEIRREMERH